MLAFKGEAAGMTEMPPLPAEVEQGSRKPG